jgi:hypothetical protein
MLPILSWSWNTVLRASSLEKNFNIGNFRVEKQHHKGIGKSSGNRGKQRKKEEIMACFSTQCIWERNKKKNLSHRRVNLNHSSYMYDSSHKVIQTTTILPAHYDLSTRFSQCRNFT